MYRLPVANIINTPIFLTVDICKFKIAGTGRMKRYQSSSRLITLVGTEKSVYLK